MKLAHQMFMITNAPHVIRDFANCPISLYRNVCTSIPTVNLVFIPT